VYIVDVSLYTFGVWSYINLSYIRILPSSILITMRVQTIRLNNCCVPSSIFGSIRLSLIIKKSRKLRGSLRISLILVDHLFLLSVILIYSLCVHYHVLFDLVKENLVVLQLSPLHTLGSSCNHLNVLCVLSL